MVVFHPPFSTLQLQILASLCDLLTLKAIASADLPESLYDIQTLASLAHRTCVLWKLSGLRSTAQHLTPPLEVRAENATTADIGRVGLPIPACCHSKEGISLLEQGREIYKTHVIDAHQPGSTAAPASFGFTATGGSPPSAAGALSANEC